MTMGTSMYDFNPYMNTGLNADFMSTATSNPYTNPYADPYSQLAALQQPTADTFQKSEGGSGLNSGLKLAAVGGVGAGAGAYFFGDKLGINLVKDGKVADGLITSINSVNVENTKNEIFKKLYEAEVTKKLPTGMTIEQYNAIQQLAKSNGIDDLSQAVKDKLPTDIQTPENARNKLNGIKIDEIDQTKLSERAAKLAKNRDLNTLTERLSNLQSAKTKLTALGENASKAEIETFIKANPEAFGLKGKSEAEITTLARKIANKYDTRSSLLSSLETRISKQTTNVENLKNSLRTQVNTHWDDAAKAFRADAPEALTKAAKNFKWAKAGKFAAIAAGAGLVLGWMFGGNKS